MSLLYGFLDYKTRAILEEKKFYIVITQIRTTDSFRAFHYYYISSGFCFNFFFK